MLSDIRSRGFSLTEILVVISVVLILSGLLIISVSSVRGTAESSRCVSNLRNLYMGLMTEAQEQGMIIETATGGSFPARALWNWNLRIGSGSMSSPTGVLPGGEHYRCPALPNIDPRYDIDSADWPWVSYGINGFSPEVDTSYRIRDANGNPIAAGIRIHIPAIESPGTFILLVDSYNTTNAQQSFRLTTDPRWGLHLRHNGRANAVFLDGHVESLAPESLGALDVLHAYDANGRTLPIN